ncbi:4203_t:CDS:2 [Cetraspora pellucida]|uniref:4203_t:CDS:1 n=1 Tax=Cetraspora pellucida TaxID=1433469 RepID=A0A9N9DMM8_9GLOM|nr:4203_t:CDS:2 [Cetraspora pellucida]
MKSKIVLKDLAKHFRNQFRKRRTKLKEMPEKALASLVLETKEIPKKWKIAQAYSILKDVDWEYNLNNIRPIALIETFKKLVTKIITRRLAKIFTEREILKEPNYAGLLGNSTEQPIYILNIKIEEWALKKDKILQRTIKYIINLFYKCQLKVITAHSLTEKIIVGDDIDQEELFYDLLLERIQEDKSLSYTVEQEVLKNTNINCIMKHRQAVIAYVDNTIWITKSKDQLLRILKIAEEFFKAK